MGRIRKAYEIRFRTLLQRVRARRLEPGVRHLLLRADRLAEQAHIPQSEALTRVYEQLSSQPHFRDAHPRPAPELFLCDSGLGGLARWLRAAGYNALWHPQIDDDALLHKAQQTGGVILTTDSLLMERRLLREQVVSAFWLPPTLSISEQLARAFREFNLRAGEPRCMRCGGQLQPVDKQSIRERIPPKTYRWLDKYFLCQRCGHLFWRGTHWDRIRRRLEEVSAAA